MYTSSKSNQLAQICLPQRALFSYCSAVDCHEIIYKIREIVETMCTKKLYICKGCSFDNFLHKSSVKKWKWIEFRISQQISILKLEFDLVGSLLHTVGFILPRFMNRKNQYWHFSVPNLGATAKFYLHHSSCIYPISWVYLLKHWKGVPSMGWVITALCMNNRVLLIFENRHYTMQNREI